MCLVSLQYVLIWFQNNYYYLELLLKNWTIIFKLFLKTSKRLSTKWFWGDPESEAVTQKFKIGTICFLSRHLFYCLIFKIVFTFVFLLPLLRGNFSVLFWSWFRSYLSAWRLKHYVSNIYVKHLMCNIQFNFLPHKS